ncbi:hypothetical protein DUNSADRAFT_9636 [Dunaliella salina]|uniref:Encoded protein n=1 Tax=Dunaliella salina TaxID=3046 RepID=A0ABQ7GH07_DUNSA|nr:hypothetical protein DUNSADRAFT_9636 [Dunaliella salina]|eukprot:KAF5833888.1 hypothetical protein DUNSADRAFT_9636 [Dunaliella salina]
MQPQIARASWRLRAWQSLTRTQSTTHACFKPDLYEGYRDDRRPYPNPIPGGSKNGSSDPDDAHLPPDTYEIQGDPSSPSAHPSAKGTWF